MDPYQEAMRAQLRELRNIAGLSYEALAEKSGLSVFTICRIETGLCNPRIDTLEYIAGALGCKLVVSFEEI